MALRYKQRVFVEEYLRCWNTTQAAKAAGYSEKTAYSIGQENLKKPVTEACIQKRLTEMKMSADQVLLLLADQARASFKPFIKIRPDGFVSFDFSQPEALEHLHLIKKIKTKRSRRIVGRGDNAETWEEETVEVELHDAQTALQLFARHLGLFDDKPKMDYSLNIKGFYEMLDKVYGNSKGG